MNITLQYLLAKYSDVPEIIIPPVVMTNANEDIEIFSGSFTIVKSGRNIVLDGWIKFCWLPTIHLKFWGRPDTPEELSFGIGEKFQIIVNSFHFAESSHLSMSHLIGDHFLEGRCNQGVLGDKSIPASVVNFSIPNMREYFGEKVKEIDEENLHTTAARLTFDNDEYLVKIDKLTRFKRLSQLIDEKSGYIILYGGELTKKKGNIVFEELEKFNESFNQFLYFLNGRRTSMLFQSGVHEGITLWKNCTAYQIDNYLYSQSWSEIHSISGFNELWRQFSKLWIDSNHQDFLETAIHWYLEANDPTRYIESCIMTAQAALELIYNWLIVEQLKIITGKDAENITADNKFRLLLNQLRVSTAIPNHFSALISIKRDFDGPSALTFIRNALVHGQEKKRMELKNISIEAKFQARQLAIWYIELALLYILGYKGKYRNRTSSEIWINFGEDVPWAANI